MTQKGRCWAQPSRTTQPGLHHLLLVLLVCGLVGTARVAAKSLDPPQQQNGTVLAVRRDMAVRFIGERFLPLSLEDQRVMLQASADISVPRGEVNILISYKESPSKLVANQGLVDRGPYVDMLFTVYSVLENTSLENLGDGSWLTKWNSSVADSYGAFLKWGARTVSLGQWNGVNPPRMILGDINPVVTQLRRGYRPVVVLTVGLNATFNNSTDGPKGSPVDLASAVGEAVRTAVVGGDWGTFVEVVGVGNRTQLNQLVVPAEVTVFACDNSSLPTPQCEEQLMAAVLANMTDSEEGRRALAAAGIQALEVAGASQRKPPTLVPIEGLANEQAWIPWHLDRISQRSLPLDGRYNATATGAGVNVYVMSTGIRGSHNEFKNLDGSQGARVVGAWGFKGMDPLHDCDDADMYMMNGGTYLASLCCGATSGVARGATVHSVKIRKLCSSIYEMEAVPQALEAVLATYKGPAVLLIATWWRPTRSAADASIADRILKLLDALNAQNVTVVAPASSGLEGFDPCSNIFASHPATITVASSDTHDQASIYSPRNSSCIKMWAPGGGLGTSLMAAHPTSDWAFVESFASAFSASALVAGVAAQHLQLHPNATPVQVLEALQSQATPDSVIGAGTATPYRGLLFTNYTDPAVAASDGGGGLSTGSIVGLALAASVVAVALPVVLWVVVLRRSREKKAEPKLRDPGWGIDINEIEFCVRPDGSEWLLGVGRHSKVYKATRAGVQLVAVKVMSQVAPQLRAVFKKEFDIWRFLSRDANITSLYGVVDQGQTLMLVSELMEGGDLRNALSSDEAAELQWYKRGKDIMLDVVRGVQFLHSVNIAHRDIKSKNILLSKEGKAKLCDVGLAHILSEGPSRAIGTFAWAAPELLLGGEITDRCDIFSLGVCLWEVVTLEVPLRGRMRAVNVPDECPQCVADAIAACMAADPEGRPSAGELRSMLEAQAPSESGSGDEASSRHKLDISSDSSRELTTAVSASIIKVPMAELCVPMIDNADVEISPGPPLGVGSFGTVVKVTLGGKDVMAAKRVELGHSGGAYRAFLRESALLYQLRHPHVTEVVGVSVQTMPDGSRAGLLIMELMEGGSLHERLHHDTYRRVPSGDGRPWGWYKRGKTALLQIAKGLHHLHLRNVVHFDLKPANVLLDAQDNCKLADVGMARLMSHTHLSMATNDLGCWGTLGYMAPELMLGSRCSTAADVFSFGIMIWEICTGSPPQFGRPRPELVVPNNCPAEVVELYKQCTHVDPAVRPKAREIVERLTRIIEDGGSGEAA